MEIRGVVPQEIPEEDWEPFWDAYTTLIKAEKNALLSQAVRDLTIDQLSQYNDVSVDELRSIVEDMPLFDEAEAQESAVQLLLESFRGLISKHAGSVERIYSAGEKYPPNIRDLIFRAIQPFNS